MTQYRIRRIKPWAPPGSPDGFLKKFLTGIRPIGLGSFTLYSGAEIEEHLTVERERILTAWVDPDTGAFHSAKSNWTWLQHWPGGADELLAALSVYDEYELERWTGADWEPLSLWRLREIGTPVQPTTGAGPVKGRPGRPRRTEDRRIKVRWERLQDLQSQYPEYKDAEYARLLDVEETTIARMRRDFGGIQ